MWVFEEQDEMPRRATVTYTRAAAKRLRRGEQRMKREQFSMPPPSLYLSLSEPYHIGYVTTNIDRATQEFAERYGVSKFRISRRTSSLPGMPAMLMDQAHAFAGPLQIELIHPLSGDDDIYRDLLPAEGFAIRHHHFGFMMNGEADIQRIAAALAANGIPIAFDAFIPNVERVILADARAVLGHYLEYTYLKPKIREGYYADVPHN